MPRCVSQILSARAAASTTLGLASPMADSRGVPYTSRMSNDRYRRELTLSALAALFALSLIACARPPRTLFTMDNDVRAVVHAYDRKMVEARKAAMLAGSGNYVTVGAKGCDYADIGTALKEAPVGAFVFYLMDPLYGGVSLTIRRDVALIGFGALDTVIEGAADPADARGGVLSIEAGVHAYVSGVTVRGGKVTDVPRRGGGVSNSGDLVMEDCAIIDNLATYGVGVWTEGRAELRRCSIAGNRGLRRPMADEYAAIDCGGKGAGLRVEKGGSALVQDCVLAFNRSVSSGGAVHVSCEASASLVDCVLFGNVAKDRGGAVDSAGGSIELIRCTIAGNSAGTKGQAIFHRGKLSISGCLLADNGAGKAYYRADDNMGEYGGGVFGLNEGNFDASGSLPLAETGDARYVRANASAIRSSYGAGENLRGITGE